MGKKKHIDTYFGYCHEEHGFFSSNEQKWINRINKLIEEYPDKIRVIKRPEENDDTIYVELPTTWLKVQPPKKMDLTDEQRAALRERMLNIRKNASESQENSLEN